MQFGFYDDQQVLGNTTWAFNQLRLLRGVCPTLDWGTVAQAASGEADRSRRPAPQLTDCGRPRRSTRRTRGIRRGPAIYDAALGPSRRADAAALMISGPSRTPRGATAARTRSKSRRTSRSARRRPFEAGSPGTSSNNPVNLARSGRWSRRWRVQAAYDYAKICSAICRREVDPARGSEGRLRSHGPRGNDARAARGRRPRRSSSCPGSAARACRRMDAYAHHPYYGHRSEKPATVSRSKKAVTMGNIGC